MGGLTTVGPRPRSTHEAEDLPRVTVLMATYNGAGNNGQWLDQQIDSILNQRDVNVRLVVSDDASSDATRAHIEERARKDARIVLLPQREGIPGVTGNFLHLFTTQETDGSYVALSDQDDVWHEDKLSRQLHLLSASSCDIVSSNVVSFRSVPDGSVGEKHLIVKSQPQRRWDYLFEAAGPGSTYLFTPGAHARLVDVLTGLDYSRIGVHDWYLYVLARALGLKWKIGADATLDYRQHGGNVQGANSGSQARAARMEKLRNGFYLGQFLLMIAAVQQVGNPEVVPMKELARIEAELRSSSFFARLRFFFRWPHVRRSRSEGLKLAASRLLGVW